MAALLVGIKTALYMMNRLKAYMDYLRDLPLTSTRTNFETSLTELHALILQFLARAIQTYQSSTLTRLFNAFWKPEEVRDFENECDEVETRVEIEASNCDRTLSALEREGANKLDLIVIQVGFLGCKVRQSTVACNRCSSVPCQL